MKRLVKILGMIALLQWMTGCVEPEEQEPVCKPVCGGMECGSDGCGGSCGVCELGTICYYGRCLPTTCVPNCDGLCIPPCEAGTQMCQNGMCIDLDVCNPACNPNTQICRNGKCVDLAVCTPNCTNRLCGSDGCGGFCGSCTSEQYCSNYRCLPLVTCTPDCTNKACGSNGCGGSCGSCAEDQYCSTTYQCLPKATCTPDCTGKVCGDDGCGGSCGTCTSPLTCVSGQCETAACIPYCTDRVCGSNGCGGSCGTCPANSTCDESTGHCLTWQVSGKLMLETKTVYYDKYQLPKLDQSVDIPAYQIPLTLRDKDGNEIGNTIVSEDGTFSIQMNRLPIATDWLAIIPNWYVNGKLQFGLVVASANKPYLSWVWSLPLSKFGQNGNYSNLGTIRITENEASGGLYLYQQILKAFEELPEHGITNDISKLSTMAVVWSPGITWSCGTCFVNNQPTEIGNEIMKTTMYVGGDTSEESVWGYPTLLHEFGHYVLATIYEDSTPGGAHNLSTACDPQLAWSEGFATFYAMMMLSLRTGVPVSQYWRVINSGSYWLDYAHLYESSGFGSIVAPKPQLDSPKLMKQDLGEAWVTYMLYNFWDGLDIPDPTLPGDDVYLGTPGIVSTLASNRYLKWRSKHNADRKTYGVDFIDFTDAILCGADNDNFSRITNYIHDNNFPYDNTPVCN